MLSEPQQKFYRNSNMDIARIVAMISVTFNHAIYFIYPMGIEAHTSRPIILELLIEVMFTFSRLGVPIYLFLSGFLLLHKKLGSNKEVQSFYKKNLCTLLVTTQLWNVIYILFVIVYKHEISSMKQIISIFLFLSKVPYMDHMWYMPMIIGLYIAIPFISQIVKQYSPKILSFAICIAIIYSFLIPSFNILFSILKLEGNYQSTLKLEFFSGPYSVYLLWGYYIGIGKFRKIHTNTLVMINIFSFFSTCLFQYWSFQNQYEYNVGYNFIGLLLASVTIFELLMRIPLTNDYLNRLFLYLSNQCLGIFFLHVPIQMLLLNCFELSNQKIISLFILSFSSILISLMFIWIFKRIPIFKKWLFHIK